MERISLQFRDRQVQSVWQRGQCKFVQLSLGPGQGLTKHRAPLALHVIVLTGCVRFTVGDRTEILNASDMLALEPNVEHAVESIGRSTVLLVLTPDPPAAAPVPAAQPALEHENVLQHPELIEQIAPELRPLIEDHRQVCRALLAITDSPDEADIRGTLQTVEAELHHHFSAEEEVLFPRVAPYVGGKGVGPVARLLEEHRHIRTLYAEAKELLAVWERHPDAHAQSLLASKVRELSGVLLNHLGKEDSHLFPMASRLLSAEEKSAIAAELRTFEPKTT